MKKLKNTIKILGIIFLLNIISLVSLNKVLAQGVPVTFQTFYDELSPYGQWVQNPELGYVWVPNAGPEFTPYHTAGHWANTNYGMTWVSDYNWGWAPFHYGRWASNPNYGWYWVPGNEWGPAWVFWRRASGYYGWAPMEPGVEIARYNEGYVVPADHWVFCDERYVADPYWDRYYVPRERNVEIYQNTTYINNTYVENNTHYVSGPKFEEVQRVSATPVRRVEIRESSVPGQTVHTGDQISIYRPAVNKAEMNSNYQPVPKKIYNREEITPPHQRENVNQTSNQNQQIRQQNNGNQNQQIRQQNNGNQNQQIRQQNNGNQNQQIRQQNNGNNNGNNQQVKTIYVCPGCGAVGYRGGKCGKCGKYFEMRTVKN